MIYKDKIAVVTGSTQGLGESIAVKLAREGARGLVITGRNELRGERVARDLLAIGCKAIFVKADLESEDAPQIIFSIIDNFFEGRIHGLVNSAAHTGRGSIEETSIEDYNRLLNVNVRAPFFLTQEAVKRMQQHKIAGSILNIGSTSGFAGQEFLSAYATSKGALTTLTKNVANSQRFHKIRCNAILPGWMDTPAEHEIQTKYHGAPEDWLQKAEASRPFGKLIKPEEVADLAALILSDKGGVMTGAIIAYDQLVVESVDL